VPEPRPLEAATIDGYGTLLRLAHPVEQLRTALREHGLETDATAVARSFAAEVDYYRPRSHVAHDQETLTALRHECVAVFLRELGADLEPAEFADQFIAALVFEPIAGVREALLELQALGLNLACVANWDISLHAELDRLRLTEHFELVLTSAGAGVPKPDPAIFERALADLGVDAAAAVHIGDEDVDRLGAAAAGMRFEPIPLATLPARLAGAMAS
jgi:putative hydrolase of the HAD superfamily